MESSTSALADRVRDLVRQRRIDPRTDTASVRLAAIDAIAEHEARSLTGAVRTLDEPEVVIGQIVADVSGFGPLQAYLDDDTVEEVWINEPSRVFIARAGRHELTSLILSAELVRELVERMLSTSGRRLDISQPFVDAMLPGGHRLHVVLDGIARGFAAVNIRKFVAKAHSLDDLVALGTLDPPSAAFLDASVRAGLNIVVSGGTQAGKTTLLNCLAASIPGSQRLVSVEEVFELQCGHPDWVAMQTRQAGLEGTGAIDLRMLVKEALRMRPSRIVIGEVRAAECLDLLLALNAGLPGMASIHANSARQALVKLCTLPLLAGDNIGSRFVVPTVAAAVDIVVHTGLDPDGSRAVREIVAVTGRVENDLIESDPVFARQDGRLVRGHGAPLRREAFEQAGIDLDAVLGVTRWAP
ncbi:CpaF family protein [Aeromicrobium sp. SMF47]|uniref:CpaF family protein n=1 Tax=Aeromicrobium yanjiei TaxID=2662028 RepID=A0A5Q2MK57_9ACTN|nr:MULTISPECIES: ATPase, T2SS/T4P/T4SS family [Aeromicrobium]MRJ76691.1 CpaF family protein [Aeromicrobium yanjiei]MRK01036.1 CpaF family protein [Aeromicrobium sp. S22]QGG42159.1 CpaF family protein [Aeromicrobium yanjiei]